MRATTAIQTMLTLVGLVVAAWAVALPVSAAFEADLRELAIESSIPPRKAASVGDEVRRAHALFGLIEEGVTPSTPRPLAPFPARLLGTLRARGPGRSAAALAMPGGRVLTVWEGDDVLDARIDSIERDAIWLHRGDQVERLAMGTRPTVGTNASRTVTQLSPTNYAVSRQAVLARMSNLYALSSSMRLVPAFREGATLNPAHPAPSLLGFRFFATRPDADLLALGLRNGDVVRSINGTSLDSVERVVGLASSLLSSPSVDLQLERDGQLITHHYRLD